MCCRIDFPTDGRTIAGATPDRCSVCEFPITIAPSGRVQIARRGLRAVCLACGAKLMRQHNIAPEPPSPEQQAEIEAAIAAELGGRDPRWN